jgi:hypothetical protein
MNCILFVPYIYLVLLNNAKLFPGSEIRNIEFSKLMINLIWTFFIFKYHLLV